MRVIICGGRDYEPNLDDYTLLNRLHMKHRFTEVVTGGARGADAAGERWAREWEVPLRVFPADWKAYGRSAGPKRNQTMAENADAIVIFPGGKGTADMRSRAMKRGLHVLYDASLPPRKG